jgi:hypothetical protein
MSEFEKIYLNVDEIFSAQGKLFGEEWNEAIGRQKGFLLSRPLILKVQAEKIWGPARLDVSVINEFREVQSEVNNSNKVLEIEELADMTLLLITLDNLNPDLVLPVHQELAKIEWEDIVGKYCEDIDTDKNSLIPVVIEKIKLNKLRNPSEAFKLVANEDLETSKKRMEHNWNTLKKNRKLIEEQPWNKDWWKKALYVDEGGWIKECNVAHS